MDTVKRAIYINSDGATVLEFGQGLIATYRTDTEILLISDGTFQGETGTLSTRYIGKQMSEIEATIVRMVFPTIQSIDVMIAALEALKTSKLL